MKRDVPRLVADHEAAHSAVADEDVGAETEDDERHAGRASGRDRAGELAGRRGVIQEVRRTSNAEGRVWSERHGPAHAGRPQLGGHAVERRGRQ